MSSRLTFQ